MSVVGFDFGTTNSLISYIAGQRPINFLDPQGLPYPSIISYEGSKKIIGQDAKKRLSDLGIGIHGNIIRSPKFLLGQQSVFIDGVERSPIDIVSDLVKYIKNACLDGRRQLDLLSIDHAVVTIPVNMNGKKRSELRSAFLKSGIHIVRFIHEPLAALYGYIRTYHNINQFMRKFNQKLVLVFDWGGGTLDLTLCKIGNGFIYQIANDGTEEVGGDLFDVAIRNEILRIYLSKIRNVSSYEYSNESMNRLLSRCERAKIDLSQRNKVEIYVNNFFKKTGDNDFHCSFTATDIENTCSGLLCKGMQRINNLLSSINVSTSEVSLCLVTGGMSNMPPIQKRLHEIFGPERVHITDRSATLVAEGAAWIAHDKVDLYLAKNVELSMARNKYLPLIKSKTRMPVEGEIQKEKFILYCVDPRDGFAKFQIVTPLFYNDPILPTDPRDPLDTLVVKVDSQALPFRERLELDISIDDNLILHSNVRSTNKNDSHSSEIHNLEFGLSLSTLDDTDDKSFKNITSVDNINEPGAVTLRSNISNTVNNYFVPGELVSVYNPEYMDVRSNPPQIQIEEKLYYQPCSICKRPYNDPNCNCDKKLR